MIQIIILRQEFMRSWRKENNRSQSQSQHQSNNNFVLNFFRKIFQQLATTIEQKKVLEPSMMEGFSALFFCYLKWMYFERNFLKKKLTNDFVSIRHLSFFILSQLFPYFFNDSLRNNIVANFRWKNGICLVEN